jgi:hypothetical protein
MKDEAPLGSPFIGEPRCGRSVKVVGRAASACGQKLSNLSPRCGGLDKEEYGRRERREKRGKVAGLPHLASTQLQLSFLTISCSSHAHSTDQKHQK